MYTLHSDDGTFRSLTGGLYQSHSCDALRLSLTIGSGRKCQEERHTCQKRQIHLQADRCPKW